MRFPIVGILCILSASALAQTASTPSARHPKSPEKPIILLGNAAFNGGAKSARRSGNRSAAKEATSALNAEQIPLPRPRPPEAGPGNGATTPADVEEATAPTAPEVPPEPPPPSACFVALSTGFGVVTQLPPISLPNGCEAPDVVRLDAVIVSDQRRISINPPAVLRCPMATEIVNWIRTDLVPTTDAAKLTLTGIENYDSFECRGRNRIVGAKTSEHGKANALDVRALLLPNKKRITLTDPEVDHQFRDKLKADVCARFSTVLGPGSDGYHEEHIHLDLAERRNNYKICQWNVLDRVIPLPRERPAEAPPREQAATGDAPADDKPKP